MPLKLMYITNNPEIAVIAEDAGVDRIFIDMEFIGKDARQGGLDTVQNHHTIQDIKNIKEVVHQAEIVVRINPIHEGYLGYMDSKEEIDAAIDAGADILIPCLFLANLLMYVLQSFRYKKKTNRFWLIVGCIGALVFGIYRVIIGEYAENYEQLVVIHQVNQGVSVARNAGLKIAKGEYIGFVDPDDWIAPEMYESMYIAMKETNTDLIICGYDYYDEQGQVDENRRYITKKNEIITQKDVMYRFSDMPPTIRHGVVNKLFKKELLQGNKFKEGFCCFKTYSNWLDVNWI